MHGARGGDDQGAFEEVDRGKAAAFLPDVGLDAVLNDLDQILGALLLAAAVLLAGVGAATALDETLAGASAATTAATACLSRGLDVEFRRDRVGEIHDQVVDRIDTRDQFLVGEFLRRDLN